MKNSIVFSTAAVACAMALSITGSYATNGRRSSSIHTKATITIHENFPHAQHVRWSVEGKDQVALFKEGDRDIKCLFSTNGRLESTLITSCNAGYLPFELQVSLSKKYPGYVPQTVDEYISPGEHAFYVLLKNQQEKVVKWMRVKTDEDGNAIQIIQTLHQNV